MKRRKHYTGEHYIIEDWAGNRITDRKGYDMSFDTFEDGWSYIYEQYPEDTWEEFYVLNPLDIQNKA